MTDETPKPATYVTSIHIDDDHGCVRVRLGDGERFMVHVMSFEEARQFAEAVDERSNEAEDWVEKSEIARLGLGPDEEQKPEEKPS